MDPASGTAGGSGTRDVPQDKKKGSQVDASWTTVHVHQRDLSMGIGALISLNRHEWLKQVLTS